MNISARTSHAKEFDGVIGSNLVLDCDFEIDNFSMFQNPVIWEKLQQEERTKINIMGVIEEPFASTKRFDVTFISDSPLYKTRLLIHGKYDTNINFYKLNIMYVI